jgi:hypothetical protein
MNGIGNPEAGSTDYTDDTDYTDEWELGGPNRIGSVFSV